MKTGLPVDPRPSGAGPVAAGSPITAGVVGATAGGDDPGALRRGERAVEITVAGGASLIETAVPGARVDVLVSTDPGDGPGSSFVALEDEAEQERILDAALAALGDAV